jgi:endonuclease G
MKKFTMLLSALLIGTVFSTVLIALDSSCPEHFADGKAPQFNNAKLAEKTVSLCFETFAVMHSGVSRTPLWSAEHLDRKQVKAAETIKRRNTFHPEEQLSPDQRSELSDYARSGFDRGHMSPSGDMPSERAQHESFSLANIIPQNPNNNQNLWAGIEERTRELVHRRGELYVITGPMFEGATLARINGRVLVPTHVFKAIYDPVRREAGAWIAPNEPGTAYQTVSIAELEKRININLFPSMPDEIKRREMNLPEPVQRKPRSKKEPAEEELLLRLLRIFGIKP